MKILIVDDQRSARRVIREMLAGVDEIELVEAGSVSQAVAAADSDVNLVLLDMRLSGDVRDRGGIEVIKTLRAAGNGVPVVMVTALTELSEVREAMRAGAQDYVFKDELSPELLLPIVEGFRERQSLQRDVLRLRDRVEKTFGVSAIVGSSPEIERLRRLVLRVADAQATLLLRGPTGTGKELVARAIHETSSRRDAPFVAVNCAALPGPLFESLLFGHERGAFTGAQKRVRGQLELAGRGTLLFDEIAEMPVEVQAKLLRVLEDRRFRPLASDVELPFEARILAATHADLEKRVRDGRFREDLFFRLAVVSLDVPSLEARIDDLPELLASFCADRPRRLSFAPEAIDWLKRRRWAGNVLELRSIVERLLLLAPDDTIDVATLEELAPESGLNDPTAEIDRLARELLALPDRLGSKLRAIERAVLHHAIEACNGNKSAAARLIGVHRKALERKWERMSGEEKDDDESE